MSGAEGNVVPLGLGRAALGVRPSSERPIARIHLLGSMRATTYLGDDMLPRGRKARALLGCLCLARDSVPRARLAAMLWDRFAEPQARTNFRQALRELSTAMGPLAAELIHTERETIRFKSDACWIDAVALMANERWASNTQRSDLAVLCSGELLEELDGTSASFDQWLLGERSRFSERLRTLLESEIEQAEQPGQDVKHLAAVARRLIAFDPTHEGASRTLMRALGELGERGQAIREFERCREALRTLLDAEPSTKTRAVYDAVRSFTGKGPRAEEINEPIRLQQRPTETRAVLPGRNRLRIGVLPFLGDRSSKEENLAFSLSQEIAAELARFRWFDVIAPVSLMCKPGTDAFSGFQLTLNEMDYLVEGSLSGNRHSFKVSVRLRDVARYAQPVWSDTFKLQVGELHQLDEMVTARIVSQIDPVILFIEGRPKRREHYGATGLLFLAIPLIYSMERKKYEEAGRLIEQALEIEPDNGKVLAWAAYWNLWHAGQNWTDLAGALANAERLCLRAIRADPDNAEAMGIYAHTCAWKRDFEQALYFFDRSLRLNPNLAYIWALSALSYCYLGEADEALQRLGRYRQLAPFDPYFSFFENAYTIAYTFKGEFEEAVLTGQRAVKVNQNFVAGYKPLIAALGHLGRRDEAKPYIEKLLLLEPGFSLRSFADVYPFKHQRDRERYMEGLRLAGVPEGN